MQSHLINCGTYASQPVFVIRHHIAMRNKSDPAYTYSVHTCRLREEKDGKMEVVCLRLLKGLHHKFKVGAVSGSTLYLTSLMPPVLGNILSIDLTTDVEPEVLSCQTPKFEREVDTMVALGGHLYIYGGTRRTPEGQDIVLKDIIMARVQDGTVKQPWKRLAIRANGRQPSKRTECCFFGHKSPEGRLSLYLFGGMQIKGATRNE
ncbi:g11089 [Coccomyxa viridis]|uniref:G11089 protein n=1 Tax=Coccomyxa viridis TaxID=1274662 RepID=A0ABP1GB88_9CHLO